MKTLGRMSSEELAAWANAADCRLPETVNWEGVRLYAADWRHYEDTPLRIQGLLERECAARGMSLVSLTSLPVGTKFPTLYGEAAITIAASQGDDTPWVEIEFSSPAGLLRTDARRRVYLG